MTDVRGTEASVAGMREVVHPSASGSIQRALGPEGTSRTDARFHGDGVGARRFSRSWSQLTIAPNWCCVVSNRFEQRVTIITTSR